MWCLISRLVVTHLSFCFSFLDYWLHIESSWYHCPWCMLGYCIRLRHWHVDYIDWSFRLSLHINSSGCMITLLTLTCTLFSLHISFIFTCLILSCILSWLLLSTLSLPDIFRLAYVWIWMIYTYFAWLSIAWHLSFRVIAWVACLCGTHTYPLISKSLISVDIIFLGSHIWYETCCFVCSSTELVIRNMV